MKQISKSSKFSGTCLYMTWICAVVQCYSNGEYSYCSHTGTNAQMKITSSYAMWNFRWMKPHSAAAIYMITNPVCQPLPFRKEAHDLWKPKMSSEVENIIFSHLKWLIFHIVASNTWSLKIEAYSKLKKSWQTFALLIYLYKELVFVLFFIRYEYNLSSKIHTCSLLSQLPWWENSNWCYIKTRRLFLGVGVLVFFHFVHGHLFISFNLRNGELLAWFFDYVSCSNKHTKANIMHFHAWSL